MAKKLGIWKIIYNFANVFSTNTIVGKFTEFKLLLKSMPQGTHTYEYHLDKKFFTDMESSDVRDADLAVNLTVTLKGDIYELHFKVSGEIVLLCDRCLDDLHWPVDTTYDIAVKYGEGYNDDSDELLEIPESDNYLNVAYMLYDTVELVIPIKHVHPAGKCNKAMSQLLRKHRSVIATENDEDAELEEQLIEEVDNIIDDEDQAVDPRWNALKNLKIDNNN